jgi:hypothetical protein
MANKKWNIAVIGSKNKVSMDLLRKYGTVKELSLKEIFGFEPDMKPTEEKKKGF